MLARGRQGVRMGVTVDENTFSSWGIENATKRDCGNGCTTP